MKNAVILMGLLMFQLNLMAIDCNCTKQFEWLKITLEFNYPGFQDKVKKDNKALYQEFTNDHALKASKISDESECFEVLLAWTKWFKDEHIQMRMGDQDPETVRAKFKDWPKIDFTEETFKTYLSQKDLSNSDEGIYTSDDGSYKIGLRKSKKESIDYEGFILKADSVYWMPGQVKLSMVKTKDGYDVNYYMRDHSLNEVTGSIKDHVISFSGLGSWYRSFPPSPKPVSSNEKQSIYKMEALDDNTMLFVIPTMNESYRKEFKKLIKSNKQKLKKTENLIIDVRNNGGGSDFTYFSLRPFIYTQAYTWHHTQNYSTKINNQKYHDLGSDKNYPALYRWYFKRKGKSLDKKLGQMVGKKGPGKSRLWKKHKYPRNIAVLMNDGCASSCEQFVLFAQQSTKVTTMGTNSGGVLDYGNLHSISFPEANWRLNYPTTRKSAIDYGLGIDGVGIEPDLRINEGEQDWVAFAQNYLEEKK